MPRQRATQAGLALVLGALGFGLARATPPVTVSGRVERGRYLVSAIGCGACHTPKTMTATGPKSDPSRFLAGHPEGASLGPPPPLGAGPWVSVGAWDTSHTRRTKRLSVGPCAAPPRR